MWRLILKLTLYSYSILTIINIWSDAELHRPNPLVHIDGYASTTTGIHQPDTKVPFPFKNTVIQDSNVCVLDVTYRLARGEGDYWWFRTNEVSALCLVKGKSN